MQDLNTDGLGWAGLVLVNPRYQFACNGTQMLLTGADGGCWQASVATWAGSLAVPEGSLAVGLPPGLPVVPLRPVSGPPAGLGSVDAGPWRLPADHVLAGSGASWMWAAPDPLSPAVDDRPGLPYAVFSTQLVAAPVPEPGAGWMAGAGLLAAAGLRGWRGRRTPPGG